MVELSLVFPCYREEPHLEANITRVLSIISMLKLSCEIILVDDCSPDRTREVINNIIKKYPEHNIRAVFHTKNQGRGAAFMNGFTASNGEIVGFFDVDLEIGPVYFIECLRMIQDEKADLAIGKRYYKINLGLLHRHILSVCYSWLVSKFLGISMQLDSESGYKFFKRSALQQYVGKFLHKGWFWDTEVVTRFVWDGFKVLSFPCLFIRNEEKKSTVRPLHDAIEYFSHLISYRKQYQTLEKKMQVKNILQIEDQSNSSQSPLKRSANGR